MEDGARVTWRDKSQEFLLFVVEVGGVEVPDDTPDKRLISQQLRGYGSMSFHAELTLVER